MKSDKATWLHHQVSLICSGSHDLDFEGIQQQLSELLKALQDKAVDLSGVALADMMAHRHPDSERFTASDDGRPVDDDLAKLLEESPSLGDVLRDRWPGIESRAKGIYDMHVSYLKGERDDAAPTLDELLQHLRNDDENTDSF